jgi:hypothetical protein
VGAANLDDLRTLNGATQASFLTVEPLATNIVGKVGKAAGAKEQRRGL